MPMRRAPGALIAAYNSARPLDDSGEPGGEPGVLDC